MSANKARKRLLQFGSICVLASMSPALFSEIYSDSESCCVMDRDLKKLRESQGLVEERAPLVIGGGIVRPGERDICVLLSFDVDQTGQATDIAVVRSYPHDRLVPSAVQSLKSYRFRPPLPAGKPPYLMLFVVNRADPPDRYGSTKVPV